MLCVHACVLFGREIQYRRANFQNKRAKQQYNGIAYGFLALI